MQNSTNPSPTTAEASKGRVLVVGLGVSGIATATRLRRDGWTPVVVERAPSRRRGGYFIALFGTGHAAAKRLGILDSLRDRMSSLPGVDIDRNGRRFPGMTFADAPGDTWMLLRGDVEEAAFNALPDDVEIRYSTTPTNIEQDPAGVTVTLHDQATDTTSTERFALVIGADGLHSTVRRLAFGPEENYLKALNYMVAAFIYPGPAPKGLEPGRAATFLEPERAVTVFAFKDHNPSVLLSYRTDNPAGERAGNPGDRIRSAFGPTPLGPELDDIVTAYDNAEERLFDSAEQVQMPSWHTGRVVLLGDAAWCVTLYAGMGVSSGLAGADLLGVMLQRHPNDLETALTQWEDTMRPHIADFQASAQPQRHIFVPSTRKEIIQRRLAMTAMRFPFAKRVADKLMPTTGLQAKNVDIVGTIEHPSLAS